MELVLNRTTPAANIEPSCTRDTRLIRQVAAGSADALHELYVLYGQRLYAYAVRITADPASAEEAVQEGLVAVWQGASKFRSESRVIAWLLGIVHHKALNQLRCRVIDSLEAEPRDPPANDALPETQAVDHEQARLLRAGLNQLSVEHRAVLELVFYQGLSLSEVAEVCGCPLGTIKSRLNYAKASLRGALQRSGLHAEDVER